VVLTAALVGCSKPQKVTQQASVERGRYLVEHVSLCADCHTPRDEHGQFIQGKMLAGAKIDFQPLHPMPAWADVAPALVGRTDLSQDMLTMLLSTGVYPSGKTLRPPMPQFRLSPQDARSVAMYLQTVKAGKE
jgi:mono/diheme cytochrome c family protein